LGNRFFLGKNRRGSSAGAMVSSAVKAKLVSKSHPSDNNDQHIHYWPIALEKDGCSSSTFLAFFKNVCGAARKFNGQNTAAFRNYWHARLGCQFHHSLAALSIRRSLVFRQKLLRCHIDDAIIDNILLVQPQMELPVHSVGPALSYSSTLRTTSRLLAGHRT
jgi:hypothetical protein